MSTPEDEVLRAANAQLEAEAVIADARTVGQALVVLRTEDDFMAATHIGGIRPYRWDDAVRDADGLDAHGISAVVFVDSGDEAARWADEVGRFFDRRGAQVALVGANGNARNLRGHLAAGHRLMDCRITLLSPDDAPPAPASTNGSVHDRTVTEIRERPPTADNGGDGGDATVDSCGWEPVDLGAALERDGPPPPTLLARTDDIRLLYPGRVHAFIGEPEGMKSWGWQVAAEQGLKAGRGVLVIDFENDEDAVVERLRALGVNDEQILHGLTYIRPTEQWSDPVRLMLAQLRCDHNFSLVVIDGVTDGMATLGLDPDKNKDAATFDRLLLKPFARDGSAVVLTDHVVKDREGRGRWAIGAQHKLAAIDGAVFIFEVVKPFGREPEGAARITLSKDKPGWLRRHAAGKTVATLNLVSHPDGGVTGGFDPPDDRTRGDGFEPTEAMERASRYVEVNTRLSKNAICVGIKPIKRETAMAAVELLTLRGYFRTEPGPKNSTLHHSVRPFRQGAAETGETQDEPPF